MSRIVTSVAVSDERAKRILDDIDNNYPRGTFSHLVTNALLTFGGLNDDPEEIEKMLRELEDEDKARCERKENLRLKLEKIRSIKCNEETSKKEEQERLQKELDKQEQERKKRLLQKRIPYYQERFDLTEEEAISLAQDFEIYKKTPQDVYLGEIAFIESKGFKRKKK